MSEAISGGPVLVLGSDRMGVARVEGALHEAGASRIHVGTARELRAVAVEEPGAVVIVVLTAAETSRGLRMLRDWPGRVAAVALSPAPAAVWTAPNRALGLRASLPLGATPSEIGAAVRAVGAGLLALHPDALTALRPRSAGGVVPGEALTAREREILELMAEGASNGTIAVRLGISRHTAKFHVAAILGKLGARTRAEAVALAVRHGLFDV